MIRESKNVIIYDTEPDVFLLCGHSDPIFVDIETTGLSPRNSHIYLIGLICIKDDKPVFESLMAENPSQEEAVLKAFLDIVKDYGLLIHFNGTTFDLPFIESRCKAYGLKFDASSKESLDIYRRISPFRKLLGLSDCKQKSIERFLKISREDTLSGDELIDVYKRYSVSGDDKLYKLLFTHNYDDLCGMYNILPVVVYERISKLLPAEASMHISDYTDVNGISRKEVLIGYDLPYAVPHPISSSLQGIHLSVSNTKVLIKIPVYSGELKLFYDDPQSYYYLPDEDMAVHKSVSAYMDRNYRQQATAATCYTRLKGTFLPQFNEVFTPVFKREYKAGESFIKFTEDMACDMDFVRSYIGHILKNIL